MLADPVLPSVGEADAGVGIWPLPDFGAKTHKVVLHLLPALVGESLKEWFDALSKYSACDDACMDALLVHEEQGCMSLVVQPIVLR